MFASLQDGAGTQPLGEGLEAAVAGQRIGYLRVSTLDQNEKRQLEGQVLDWVFTDKASGRDTARPDHGTAAICPRWRNRCCAQHGPARPESR